MALEAYGRTIGLKLSDVSVDCYITKASCGGEKAGRSPVDQEKGHQALDDGRRGGQPLVVLCAPAICHDSPLLGKTLQSVDGSIELPEHASVHLDRAYDSNLDGDLPAESGLVGVSPRKVN